MSNWDSELAEETRTFAKSVRPGDTLYYWQTGRQGGICGVATITSAPKKTGMRGRTAVYSFDLRYFRRISAPRAAVATHRALAELLRRVSQANPNVRRVLPNEAAALERLVAVGNTPATETQDKSVFGQGFGAAAMNQKVERAAVLAATKHLRSEGWQVRSVERDRCGYDLHCTNSVDTLCVEVKGVQGSRPDFIITAGELQHLQSNESARIIVVTDALIKPRLRTLTGTEVAQHYTVAPVAYKAMRRTPGGRSKSGI